MSCSSSGGDALAEVVGGDADHDGRLDEAEARFVEAQETFREVRHWLSAARVLGHLGALDLRRGRLDAARTRLEAALAASREIAAAADEGIQLGWLGLLHARCGRHDDARSCLAAGEAALRPASKARAELALLLAARAEAEQLAGDPVASALAFGEAERLASELGMGPSSRIGRELGRVRALLAGEPFPPS